MKLIFLQLLASGFSKELSKVGRIQGELLGGTGFAILSCLFSTADGLHMAYMTADSLGCYFYISESPSRDRLGPLDIASRTALLFLFCNLINRLMRVSVRCMYV